MTMLIVMGRAKISLLDTQYVQKHENYKLSTLMRQCRVLSKRRSLCFWVSDPWCQRHSSSGWDDTPGQSWRRSSAPATIHEPGDMWNWWGETRSCCCTSSCVNHSCLCRLQLVEDEFIRCELQTDEQHQSSLHHPHTYSPHQVKYYSVLRTQPDTDTLITDNGDFTLAV